MDKTARDRMKRYRNKIKEKRNETIKSVTVSGKSVTFDNPSVTDYHPILAHLIDPSKRAKLIAIVESLKAHRQLKNVYFGATKNAIGMDFVAELLKTTE